MAKATKNTQKKPAKRKAAPTRGRRRRPATKKSPARPTAKKPAQRTRTRRAATPVTALAQLLPAPVGDNEYVSRTLTILEQDRRRRARSRATRSRQLEQVVVDLKHDVSLRLDGVEQSALRTLEELTQRIRSIALVQQAVALPEQVTEQVTGAVDGVLDRVGLMRKARQQEVRASRPARRRRRAA